MTVTLLPGAAAAAAVDFGELHLPPGYTPAQPQPRPAVQAQPPLPVHDAAASGTLGTVTAACGCTITLHRARYDAPAAGGYTRHGYASRCTGCGHLVVGYMPEDGYGRARADARLHECASGCSRG